MNPCLTRQSDISDINPQRFPRETVIGNPWDQTSLTSRIPENNPKCSTPDSTQGHRKGATMTRRNRPTNAEFKTFWSVYEAQKLLKRTVLLARLNRRERNRLRP